MNRLYYGDNLDILRNYIKDKSVDLIYLDPPFNSNRNYNVLFRDESGVESDAQITAFVDTWHWNEKAEEAYDWLVTEGPGHVGEMIGALRGFVGTNQMMAYLVMMAIRLVELHRVLKPTGSLYLHCDPTASHYLKIVLDTIFGARHFRNEIIWCYHKWSVAQSQFVSNHDVILFYTKSRDSVFNTLFAPLSPGTMRRWKGKKQKAVFDDSGRRLATNEANESEGSPMADWWEISVLNPNAAERLGYPTQKPRALLDRIIQASSNPGDVVLDPFCGCGTSIASAQKLGRQWIGIDITHLAIALIRYRLTDMFGADLQFEVKGVPEDLKAARYLAQSDRYQFQWWALSLIKAKPMGGDGKEGKKGSDRGIDGTINFVDDASKKLKRVIVQVKSGKVKSGDIRDLKGTLDREKAQIAVFLTLEPPTKEMAVEAVSAGYYESTGWGRKYPRIQILTVEDLLKGATVQMPPAWGTFKQAERVEDDGGAVQGGFDFGE
jgi:site-specific DNA-methyltransferase (adenine-specific)